MTANKTDVEIAIKQLEKAVEEGKLFNHEPLNVDHNVLQANVAEYNLKHHLPAINKNSKTIVQIEDVIINKYGGKKLDTDYFYNHLTDFFGPEVNIDYLKSISPCHARQE